MSRLQLIWSRLRSSFWFLPSLIFAASIAVAVGLIEADNTGAQSWMEGWPRIFGAGAAGARGMLSTIAGSMITIVGITFSMTLVTLALASSQYTSRILRNFMADRVTQIALGTFAGIYIYCLIVLRTIRGGENEFVPSVAVSFGVLLAIGGIGILIYFIHHIASSIQASSIIAAVTEETLASIDRLLPKKGDDAPQASPAQVPKSVALRWQPVYTDRIGYLQSVDTDALVAWAQANDAVVRMERGIGEFVAAGSVLVSFSSYTQSAGEHRGTFERAYNIDRYRTIDQDPGFGIRQIVDIALRALSPSVNDTTTAVMCVDYLSAILAHLTTRNFPPVGRCKDGKLVLIAKHPTFEFLLTESLDQIRGSGKGNPAILSRLVFAVEAVAAATDDSNYRKALHVNLQRIAEMGDSLESPCDRAEFEQLFARVDAVVSPDHV